MKARDIMHADVISVRPEDSVLDAARLMLERKISGLLVMDGGNLIGILSEGDLTRRSEIETASRRSRLLEFFTGPGKLADEYIRMSGRKVHEVMTRGVCTVPETADLREVVETMEKHHVKRVPVMVGNAVIGMITRADIMRAFVAVAANSPVKPKTDDEIRRELVTHLEKQKWAPSDLVNISVKDGVITFEGAVMDQRQMQAFEVAAENIPGVKKVKDRLIWIEPISGTAFDVNNRLIEPNQEWERVKF